MGNQVLQAVVLLLGVVVVSHCSDDCRPEGCNEMPETGYCRAYMPRYGFNITSGECVRFIYGGCNKHFNNFGTKEECEEVCIEPCTSDSTTTDESTST